jgi:hypothetical protein
LSHPARLAVRSQPVSHGDRGPLRTVSRTQQF